jgi:hypothetical protein
VAALAASLLAGFSMGGVFGEPEPPREITVSKNGNNLNGRFGTVVGQTFSIEKSTTLASGSWAEILSLLLIAAQSDNHGIVKVSHDSKPKTFIFSRPCRKCGQFFCSIEVATINRQI